ncbi:MAG: RT0821/Lpp0805 family surface protein [Pseudomonadota bacterium]
MKAKFALVVVAIAFLLGACEQGREKEFAGSAIGAIAGGLLGSQFGGGNGQIAATAVGAMAGLFIGNQIGKGLDDVDKLKARQAIDQAASAPVGETISWNNPDTGNRGSVTSVRDGTSSSGLYCREYQQTIIVGGKTEEAYGTACRQPDGSWKIQS